MRKTFALALAALVAFGLTLAAQEKKEKGKVIKTDSGLQYEDLKEGTGEAAKKGNKVVVHYTGWLKDGKKFDSSVGKEPFEFELGAGEVIKGWDEGVAGMKVGGKRKLIIPSELGYGKKGAGRVIPPDAELHFEVDTGAAQEPEEAGEREVSAPATS